MITTALAGGAVTVGCLPSGPSTSTSSSSTSSGGSSGDLSLDKSALIAELRAVMAGNPSVETVNARNGMSARQLTKGSAWRWNTSSTTALADPDFINLLRVAVGGQTFGTCQYTTGSNTPECLATATFACGSTGACCSPLEPYYCATTKGCFKALSDAEKACPSACTACQSPSTDYLGPLSSSASTAPTAPPGDLSAQDLHMLGGSTCSSCPLPGGADLVFFTAAGAFETVAKQGAWTCAEAMDPGSRDLCVAAVARAVGLGLALKPKPPPIISYDSGVTEAYLACCNGDPSKPPPIDGGRRSDSGGSPTDPCGAAGTWDFVCPSSSSACGVCGVIPSSTITITIPPTITQSGGSYTAYGATFTFNASTCSSDLGASACGLSAGVLHFAPSGAYDSVIYKCANDCSNCGPGTCVGKKR